MDFLFFVLLLNYVQIGKKETDMFSTDDAKFNTNKKLLIGALSHAKWNKIKLYVS